MSKYIRFSPRASLAMVGRWMQQMGVWEIVGKHVRIKQKVIKYTPQDKLLDAMINILAGGRGLVEVNTRVRPDELLQQSFGREACAEQSTVSGTLNACSEENVHQMRQANKEIYQTHSQGYRHDYKHCWQVLDVDMTGMPAGRQGEGVTKGYISGKKGRRGRQLGRVLTTLYQEIVVERLYPGTVQLERSLQELTMAAEDVLDLDDGRRPRTIVRVDGGGGRDADVNWLLGRGYHILIRVKNWKRCQKLARSVAEWHPDPKMLGREVGWVKKPHTYVRPSRQLAIRKRNKDGNWQYRVLVFTLTDETLFWLAHQPIPKARTSRQLLLAAAYAYDLRSGGIETSIKGSKQGLGLTKRNKHRFAAQEMLVLLAQLAYNLIIWARNQLARHNPRLRQFGILRMVRDVFHIPGSFLLDAQGHIVQITLSQSHTLATSFVRTWAPIMACNGPLLNLGQI